MTVRKANRLLVAGAALFLSAASSAFAAQNAGTATLTWSRALLEQPADWYASDEARSIADKVLRYQSKEGGWPKNVDMSVWPPLPEDAAYETDGKANTFDNDATSTQMEFLARVFTATGNKAYSKSFMRGLEYTLRAQYENGGWPQFFPLRDGYYSRVTFNDEAMVRILTVLEEIADGEKPYAFVSEKDRRRAAAAIERGRELILATQVRQNGALTVWCAQYDEHTLKPAWARAYEPPSLSGSESVGILRYLMSIEDPSDDVVAAIEGGVAWLQAAAIHGQRFESFIDASGAEDRHVVADPDAGPIWARFYELVTDRPLFLGRDSVYRYALKDIEQERRAGYAYYGQWGRKLLESDYPAWKARLAK